MIPLRDLISFYALKNCGTSELWLKSRAQRVCLDSVLAETHLVDFVDTDAETMIASIAARTDDRLEIVVNLLSRYQEESVYATIRMLGLRNPAQVEDAPHAEAGQSNLTLDTAA